MASVRRAFGGEGRHVEPGVLGRTLEYSFHELHATESIDELCVLGGRGAIFYGSIEPAEYLLEGIIVAFAMAARQIGVRARFFGHQRWIFDHHLIGAVALSQ